VTEREAAPIEASLGELYRRHASRLPPGTEWFDAHTHTGFNDPDGFKASADQIVAGLDTAGHARALVFSSQEPDGYRAANDRVIAEAHESQGRLLALCRLDPRDDPVGEAHRCLDAGAVGFKLHPRAERFTMSEPAIEHVVALAHERRLPIVIHAGRGIPALGWDTVVLARRLPGARLILAHAGISDLAWIWHEASDLPNLLFDTAWWTPSDLVALLAHIPPGQVLYGSDAPYGTPLHSEVMALRCALHAGLTPEQAQAVMGEQARRIVAGDDLLELGPAPGPDAARSDLLLERAYTFILSAVSRAMARSSPDEALQLARLACEVGDAAPQAAICRSVLALIDRHDHYAAEPHGLDELDKGAHFFPGVHLMILAATVARTHSVPAPEPEPEDVGGRERG